MVNIFYEDTKILDLDPEFFASWFSEVLSEHGFSLGEVCLIICSDNYLLEMNKQHLNHDYYTDIITFNYNEGETINGDLFISIDRVGENAERDSVTMVMELQRVAVHGLLHLVGFDDKSPDDKAEMTRQEDSALARIVSRET